MRPFHSYIKYTGALLLELLVSMTVAQDNMPPSVNPPGGLLAEKVPMFVSIGFDDNFFSGLDGSGSQGGMKWILDYTRELKNPKGNLNSKTFDNSPVRCTFFNIAKYIDTHDAETSPTYIKKMWRQAYLDGHEIGNHTFNHPSGTTFTFKDWINEITLFEQTISKPYNPLENPNESSILTGVGLNKKDVNGFRTPYIHYNLNLFDALDSLDYLYDCSLEEGWQIDQDGTNFFWPYTLNNGSPGYDELVKIGEKPAMKNHPGLWEMPVYVLIIPPDSMCYKYDTKPGLRKKIQQALHYNLDNKVTGSDYNLFASTNADGAELIKEEILAILKYTFDLRYNGNRAPLLLASHSIYYSNLWNDSPSIPDVKDRQWILENFIRYVLSKPDTRIVSFIDIIKWMKDPVAIK